MGDSVKPQLRRNNQLMPHTWALGQKKSADYDLAGQAFGAHDARYKPEEQPAIPFTPTLPAATAARDYTRRLARRANGLDSTIRASSAEPYSAAPKALLGS